MSIDPNDLARAERSGETLPAPATTPADQDAAEAVQDAFLKAWDADFGGWKLGATVEEVRTRFGLSRGFLGRVPRDRIFKSGAVLPRGALRQAALELEVTFLLGADLPPEPDCPRDKIVAAIKGVCAGFELPQSRYVGLGAHGPMVLVADNGAGGLGVVGALTTDWSEEHLQSAAVRVDFDGETVISNTSAVIMDGPLGSLVHFVHQAHARGHTPRADDYVFTGNCAGMFDFELPVKAFGVIEGVGTVELTLE